jgi:hypothetical protein
MHLAGLQKIMHKNKSILVLFIVVIGLSILQTANSFATPILASSKGSAGSVVQEKVHTGNPNLDKEIIKFYSCISKTHQDPPSITKVDNCYYQALGVSGGYGNSTINSGHTPTLTATATNHHHKK